MKTNSITRVRILSFFIIGFALLLIGRLYMLQIVDNDTYSEKADRQYASASRNIFSRGTIYFQNKDNTLVSAATLKSGYIVAINPQILKNPEEVYVKVNEIIPIDRDTFIAKATKPKDTYEEIATRTDLEVGPKIEALKIKGLNVYKDRWRFYPGGSIASHTVGMLGYKGDEFAGRYGLERQYESLLLRKDGGYVNFFAQIFSDLKSVTASDGEGEADIVSTIEPSVQNLLQKVIKETNQKWSSELTGGIIMNPANGEIYAMGVYPDFDPNHPEEQSRSEIFSNPLVENVYEMGSIIKPLTIAAGIDAGVITAKSTYYDPGFVMINNKKISNFDGKERGVVSMQDVLSHSLNVGVAHVTKLLGNKVFTNYMYSFGLNEKTKIDLPNEGRNLVDNLKSPRDIEHATASFGQGIALTPISTIRALAVLANGGVLVEPHLVKEIDYKIGVSKETPISVSAPVLKKATIEEVARMMVYSADNVLLDGALKIPNYSVAVKTGTAQIANPNGGGYYEDRVLHSFVGFFPAYNPKFIVFLYTLNPKGIRFGSETLSRPFFEVTNFLINYYEVAPDR